MTTESTATGIASLSDALRLLGRGEHFVITVTPPALVSDLLPHLVHFAGPKGGWVQFASGKELGPLRVACTLSGGSFAKSVLAAKHAVARLAADAVVVFDLSQFSRTSSSVSEVELLKGLRTISSVKEFRVVWLLQEEAFQPHIITQLKSRSSFYLAMRGSPAATTAQFLSIANSASPELFLPYQVTVQKDAVQFVRADVGVNGLDGLTAGEYKRVFEDAPTGIVLFDLIGKYKKLNARAREALGFEQGDLRDRPLIELVDPRVRYSTVKALSLLKKKGKFTFATRILRKSGRIMDIEVNASALGRQTYIATCRDLGHELKERAAAAALQAEYSGLLARLPYPSAIFLNRKLARANELFHEIFPWTKKEAPSVSEFFGKKNVELLKEVSRLLEAPETEAATPLHAEVQIPTPDRTNVTAEVTFTVVQYEGKKGLYCTFVDVSQRRAVLDRAASIEEKFKTLFEDSLDGIAIVQNGSIVSVNRSFASLFGLADPMEVIGRDLVSFVSGKHSRREILDLLSAAQTGEGVVSAFRYTGKKSNGTRFEIEARAGRINLDGNPALLIYHRDISQTAEAEREISRKARGLDILNRISDELAHATTLDEIYKRGLHAAMKGGQLESGAVLIVDPVRRELVLRHHHNLGHELVEKLGSQSLEEGLARFFSKTQEPLVVSIAEYPPYLAYKGLFQNDGYASIAFLPIVSEGEFHGVLLLCSKYPRALDEVDKSMFASCGRVVSSSIDKYKLAKRVTDLQATLEDTLANVSDVLYTLSPSGTFLFISPNIEKMIGFARQDFMTNAGLWRTLLHPDDRPILSQRVSNQSGTIDRFILEYRILPKGKASYLWLRDSVIYVRDASGNVIEIRGVLTDITDARRAAELEQNVALRPSDRTGLELLDTVAAGIAVFDEELVCLAWNAALSRLTGVTQADAVGVPVMAIPIVGEELASYLDHERGTDSSAHPGVLAIEAGGLDRSFEISGAKWHDERGRARIVVTLLPIASAGDREASQEAEEVLRSVINTMQEALLITGLDGEVWEVNNAFCELTGFARDSVRLTNPPYPWLPEVEAVDIKSRMDALREEGTLADHLLSWRTSDGEYIKVAVRMELLRDASGTSGGAALWVARDVGERERLFSALEAKNRQVEVMNRIMSYANTSDDVSLIFDRIVTEIRRLVPFDAISLNVGKEGHSERQAYCASIDSSGNILRDVSIKLDEKTVEEALRTGKTVHYQQEFGQISVPLKVSGQPLGVVSLVDKTPETFSGEVVQYLEPLADHIGAIIHRLELFAQVRDDGVFIHNLLNSIESVVYTVDQNYIITQANKAWRDFAVRQGLDALADENKIIGQPLRAIIPTEEKFHHYKTVMEDLFARRIDSYATDSRIVYQGQELSYHLVIRPVLIGGKVTSLVFTYTDVTALNRSEAEINRRNKALVSLNAISSSISKSLDLDQVLAIASKEIAESFDASVVMFFLGDSAADNIMLAHQRGVSPELANSIKQVTISSSLVGLAIRSRTPIYIAEALSADSRLTPAGRQLCEVLGLESGAVVPLHAKENIPGAFLISYTRPHQFAEDERQLLVLIGSQIAAAVDNANLYAEIQSQVKTLTTLYELGKGLTGALDLRSMLQVIYREVSRAIPLDRFYYQAFLPDQKKLSLLNRIVKGVPEYYPTGHKQRGLEEWPNSIYQYVVEHGTSYIGSTSDEGYDSMIAVPIRAETNVVGVISVVSSQPERYTAVHLRLLESIANLAGVAIGKASLYEETLKKATEIENRNKDLDDFTYVVSHDLKEPLISIEGYSKIVMKDYGPQLDEEGREYLGSVVGSVNRMKHLIDDLLTLSRLGRMQEAYEQVDVRKIIDEILHDFQFSLKEKNVTVHVSEQMPTVQYSSTRLSMVFRNLISNAMKFNDKPDPVITIDVTEGDGEYVFTVADNGIGIDPQYYDRIFTIFQRLKRSEEYRGTGAGLTIAKKIVEREGGRIWVESTPGEGATFYFTIPKPA